MQTLRRFAAVPILALTLLVSGCALFTVKGGEPVPPQTEQQQLQEVDRIVTVATVVVDALASVQKAEDTLYDLRKPDGSRFITPQQHLDFGKVYATFAAESKPLVQTAHDLAATPQTRATAARQLVDLGKRTLERLGGVSPAVAFAIAIAEPLIRALVVPNL